MAADAPKRTARRAILICAVLASLPLVALLAANLTMATPLACSWAATQVTKRIGLEAHLERISYWPWSGLMVHQLQLQQPEPVRKAMAAPLLDVSEVQLKPIWREWIKGRLRFEEVRIIKPRINIAIESLKPPAPVSTASGMPTLAMHNPPAGNRKPPTHSPAHPKTAPTAPQQALQTPPQKAAPKPAITQPKIAAEAATPTRWCHIDQGSLRLHSVTAPAMGISIRGVSGSIPIGGRDATTTMTIKRVEQAGRKLLTHLKPQLSWSAPLIELKPLKLECDGLDITITGACRPSRSMPVELRVLCPPQGIESWQLPHGARVGVRQISGRGRFSGFLVSPATWSGDLIAETHGIDMILPPHTNHFTHGRMIATLHGGELRCHDFRLTGDDASVLGNAAIHSRGDFAVALRLVAAPERASAVAKSLFPSIQQAVPLTALSTPQRVAFDLEATGDIHHAVITIGRNGPQLRIPDTDP